MFWVFCRSLSATLVSSFRGGRVQISVQVFSSPNTKQSCRPIIPRKPISLPFTLKLLLLCFRFVLFLNILRFVFGFRLQIPERTSRSKCTTQAHVHEERQRLVSNSFTTFISKSRHWHSYLVMIQIKRVPGLSSILEVAARAGPCQILSLSI
ncbi:uncharacterized protein LOC112185109 isoform X2 [Rosa chinensis]|uniref:uncharacterized protein LOC112185109 isoform X2 n=1 Tax=Rosa chinensis TaxID=74649 RepID=UPI001AD90D43|nr:uncharacterized protein LOC112185109 isoform X2 [Rosa chinensis]